jgi:hypothetical protein
LSQEIRISTQQSVIVPTINAFQKHIHLITTIKLRWNTDKAPAIYYNVIGLANPVTHVQNPLLQRLNGSINVIDVNRRMYSNVFSQMELLKQWKKLAAVESNG